MNQIFHPSHFFFYSSYFSLQKIRNGSGLTWLRMHNRHRDIRIGGIIIQIRARTSFGPQVSGAAFHFRYDDLMHRCAYIYIYFFFPRRLAFTFFDVFAQPRVTFEWMFNEAEKKERKKKKRVNPLHAFLNFFF